MRDALILLLYCFLCYPRLLAQQPAASVEGPGGTSGAPGRAVSVAIVAITAVDAPRR
jgi:hypothetical protein